MKYLFLVAALLLATLPAHAQSLNDERLLASDPAFQGRVQASVLAAAVAISNEGAVTNHTQRDTIAVNVLTSGSQWAAFFTPLVAVNSTVIGLATNNGGVALTTANTAAQAALVTDAAINNAVSAAWNSFFIH